MSLRKPVGPLRATVAVGVLLPCGDTRLVFDFDDLARRMRNFTEARDWGRFHDPKSLTLALVGEVGELAELLQWVRPEDQAAVVRTQPLYGRLAEEMADVLLYLLCLADVVGVDLAQAAIDKLRINEERFPPDEHRSIAPGKA
jgi:dCTP diphosphatase